jgi:chromosome segregation ATPase
MTVLRRLANHERREKKPERDPAEALRKEAGDLEQKYEEAKRTTDDTKAARKSLEKKVAAAEAELRQARLAPRDYAPVEGPAVDAELQKRRDNLAAVQKALDLIRSSLPEDHPSRKEVEERMVTAKAAVEEREQALQNETGGKVRDSVKPLEDRVAGLKAALEAGRKSEEEALAGERSLKKSLKAARVKLKKAKRSRRQGDRQSAPSARPPWNIDLVEACGGRKRRG